MKNERNAIICNQNWKMPRTPPLDPSSPLRDAKDAFTSALRRLTRLTNVEAIRVNLLRRRSRSRYDPVPHSSTQSTSSL